MSGTESSLADMWTRCVVDEHIQLQVKLKATQAVLAIREAELLKLKGPCSSAHDVQVPGGGCAMHYAHSGPCLGPREAS